MNIQRGESMPYSKNIPTLMCPGCKNYEFKKGSGTPHRCLDAGGFTNPNKVGHDPDVKGPGQSCKKFKA